MTVEKKVIAKLIVISKNGDFVHNTPFNEGRADFTYDKNHNELKRQIFDKHGKLEETLTTRHKLINTVM